jgi:hypothetical protein
MDNLRILDIDLDFFLNNKHIGEVTNINRLENEYFKPWTDEKVVSFLEYNCGLSIKNPIQGKTFTHHDEVFYLLRDLQLQNNFKYLFQIDHVDAHADLGTGDASYNYISSDLLHRSMQERCFPDKTNGWEGLSAGNYLAFAIACRWVSSLTYINNPDWIDDLQWFFFKDFEVSSNVIQLKKYSPEQMHHIIYEGDMLELAKATIPIEIEPEVQFQLLDFNNFRSDGKYDKIFLTQSPGFTPLASDKLIPIIEQYIKH